MWKTFMHLKNLYLIRWEVKDDLFDLYLTNLENIWKSSSTNTDLFESFKVIYGTNCTDRFTILNIFLERKSPY